MTKKDIATKIAETMLYDGMLDENNYNDDTVALLKDVQSIILEQLENYIMIIGTALEWFSQRKRI